jgi:squalene-hopene/tetraprenyl-beta-curcumene cyclase
MATASALLALVCWRRRFAELQAERIDRAARLGIQWLMILQNDDGGWLTFDRDVTSMSPGPSACDVTSLVLRALAAWRRGRQSDGRDSGLPDQAHLERNTDVALERGWRYLERIQREDGSFIPLWFGNEHHPNRENPVYGTAQVLVACCELLRLDSDLALRASRWLVTAQHASGGWGPPRAPLDYSGAYKDGFRAWRANETLARFCSVEETALAVAALLPLAETNHSLARAVSNGLTWLSGAVEQDAHRQAAVIGFYSSKLWYHERLYPLAFARLPPAP